MILMMNLNIGIRIQYIPNNSSFIKSIIDFVHDPYNTQTINKWSNILMTGSVAAE